MIYGNKFLTCLLLLSFLFIVACSNNKNFHYSLYDGYSIKGIDDTIKLYKDDKIVEINSLDYKIKEFKYNSDVVCLKLSNNEYYMIYYFDTSTYGPYTKDGLEDTIESDSTMTFDNDFQNILKVEDLVYDE